MLYANRFKSAHYVVIIGLIFNMLLMLLKGIGGWMWGSQALIADATHSFTDFLSGIALFFGLRIAHLPPDKEHPYGHGKAETVTATIAAVLIALAGIKAGTDAVAALFSPDVEPPEMAALFVAILSIITKESLYRYTYRIGVKLNSQLVIASACDHRADVAATLAVVLGILLSNIGFYMGWPGLYYIDAVVGIAVSLYVIWIAFKLARESVLHTLDRVLEAEETADFYAVLSNVKGVVEVDNLFARQHGPYLIVDVKIAVDQNLTVEEGHRIGKEAKTVLLNNFTHILDVMVHINPASRASGSNLNARPTFLKGLRSL